MARRRLKYVAPVLLLCAGSLAGPASAGSIPAASYKALHWRNIGPFLGGRSIAVAGAATRPGTFYFGSTGGGVWKTQDYGLHWKLISTQTFKSGSVGALAVAPSDPNVIYVGMGESAIRGDMATGDGIYRSTDGGKTWMHVGLAHTHVISQIVIDPHNPDHVWVAALGHVFGPNPDRGVYETSDGGQHWKKVLFVNDKTGAIDLAIDPHNARILYAAMWQAYRLPWKLSSGGPGSGLYKSTDGGAHWTNISTNPGMPKGILGKIGITVSGANSNRLYAIIEAKAGGVFRSNDGGATWTRVFHKSVLTQRAWYFSHIYADPKNVNTVYAPEVGGIYKSTDGGESFSPLRPPHGDVHVLWIDPQNPKIMIDGNDGGASVSLNGGKTFSPQDNQPTAQFYHVAVDDQFPYHVYASQQDRGTIEIPSRSAGAGITNGDIRHLMGGESGFVVPFPGMPWITYAGGYDGALSKYNRRTGQHQEVDVWPDDPMGHAAANLKYRFQWTYPILISKYKPHDIYVGAQYVMRSSDGGRSWQRISPDLTRNDKSKQASSGGPLTQDNTSVEYYDTVFALAESPVRQGVLWAGSDDGLVHVSKDGGHTWSNVTPSGLPPFATISTIDPSHFDPGTAFIAARRYRQDDFKPYIYVTHDYGAHWQKITHGLPDNQSSFVVRQDTKDPDLLFAGTLDGVYVSFDGGHDWQSLQANLPHVPVRDMVIQAKADQLVLATHGRSFWILDDLEPLRELSAKVVKASSYLFRPEATYLTYGWYVPHAVKYGMGQNPPNGVVVYYDLKRKPAPSEKVSLTFSTQSGEKIASFSNLTDASGKPLKPNKNFYPPKKPKQSDVVRTDAGMNRFVWQMHYPKATKVPGAIIWEGSMQGPKIVPGTYRVTLSVGGVSQTQTFVVREDPRNTATQADLKAQLALAMQIHRKLDLTDRSILQLRAVRSEVQHYASQLKHVTSNPEISKNAKSIVHQLDQIEAALIQTKSHADEDPLNYPIRLNNKLATLAAEVSYTFARPTQQDYAVYKELAGQVDAQLAKLNNVLTEQLPLLNQLIKKSGVEPISVPPQKA
jgi:photosystem II stability/assembly factor-like uncharacterized protein